MSVFVKADGWLLGSLKLQKNVCFSHLYSKISFVKQFESSSVGFKLVQAEAWKFQPGQQVQVCILKNRLGVSKILNVKIPKYKTNKIDLKITKKNIKL